MYKLSVTNNTGEVLDLSTSPKYTVYKIEGLNPTKATVNSSVNATADGMTINSVRVESRNIVLYMTIEGDIEANRINLYKYFPVKKIVKLFFSNGTRDVVIEGLVEVIECDLFSSRQVAQISLICYNPYFKAVDDLVSSFSDVSNLFKFPFAIGSEGVELSNITTNLRKSIVNYGDIDTGAIIELYAVGQVVKPAIYNAVTAEFVRFNLTLNDGDTLTINTNTGKKSVTLKRNGLFINALGYLTPDSSFLQLASGDNVFTYQCETGTANLQIKFTTAILYGGV